MSLEFGNPNIVRAMAAMEAKRDGGDVMHVCPECGGEFASHLGALVVVEMCWACGGAGLLTSDQLSSYLARSRERSTGLDIS